MKNVIFYSEVRRCYSFQYEYFGRDILKYITSTELQAWGKTKESQTYLPLLLRRLIINNIGFEHFKILNLPGGDSIWKPGCDGIIKTTIDSIFGALGEYIIECGQSDKSEDKFKSDLEKRTQKIENQKCKVFVFITTHKFQNREKIIENAKENSLWKDIKIFDADDIETWLDFDPATTLWLAYRLGKPRNNVKSFEEIQSNWLASTKVPLDKNVILARADSTNTIEIVKSWSKNHDNRILQIRSDSREESLLFFMSSIEQSGFRNETIESIKSKIVVVCSIEEWRQIVETKEAKKFILVSMFSIPENLGVLKDQGFKIVITIGNADVVRDNKNIIKLTPLNRNLLLNVLQQRKTNIRWNDFFKQFRNNISLLALQRVLARDDAPLCIPKWLKKENGLNCKILLLSALVGKWNENNSKDKEVVSKICGLDYAEVTELLFSYTKFEEAPIRKIGSIWEVSAPRIIIDYIGNYLTEKDFVRYLETIKYVYLETIKIKNTVSASQKYYEKPNCYSDELLEGIAQGLVIINSREEIFDQTLYIKEQSSDLVYEIFKERDSWQNLGRYLPLFAEVAPENILESIHDIIKTDPRSINENTEYILKAIEILANYNSNFFRDLVNLLVNLQKRCSNDYDPLNLLAKILCPWTGYTSVQIKRMKDILLDIINTEYDHDLVRSLLLKIIQLRSCEDNDLPFSQTNLLIEEYRANDIELFEFYQFLFEQLLNILDITNAADWEKTANSILHSFLSNKEELFKQLFNKLSLIEWNSTNEYFKHEIFNMINRGLENENNQNNLWNKDVNQCKKLLHKISGNDPIYERTYKFLYHLNSNYYEPIQELQKIIQDISDDSLNKLITFAEQLPNPSVFGYQLRHFKFKSDQIRDLLNIGEQRSNKIHRIMSDFFAVILNIHGIRILDKIFNFQWNVEYKKLLITHILGTTDFLNWLKKHDLLELYLKNIKDASWESTEELYESVVQGLNDVGNYTAMLQLVYWQLVIKKLDGSVKNEDIINALNGLEYNYNLEDNTKIQKLLEVLQTRKNINRQDMLQLEFKYSDLFFSGEIENLKPMEIYRIFRDNPKSFIDILKGKSKSKIESSQNLQAIRLVIKYLCYQKVFPFGTKEQFWQWIDELLFNLKDTDQETIKLCIYRLGNIVANSPKDSDDNIWPAKYLREIIEAICAHNLFDRKNREYFEEGVITYKFNSIGPVFIDETYPGKPYADLAEQIRKDIIDIRDMYPCTASMLEKLAKTYQRHSVFSANRWNAQL